MDTDMAKEQAVRDKAIERLVQDWKRTNLEKTAFVFGFLDGWKAAIEYLREEKKTNGKGKEV